MFCMTCGKEKELKSPSKSVATALEETARDNGAFNYTRTVGFCTPSCATKGLATFIITTGGKGFHCSSCGKVIGEACNGITC